MQYTSREVYEYISQKTDDPIVERRVCVVSGTEFPICQSDVAFYDKISPTFNGKKCQIPYPTLCPEERQRRRMAFRNERKLYKRKCDATGESMVSIYSPDKPYKVYNQKFRGSDSRDAMQYGRGYNGNEDFFAQFESLLSSVPKSGLVISNCENCEYCANISNAKNCYLCCGCSGSSDLSYTDMSMNCDNLIDCLGCFSAKVGYEAVGANSCYKVFYVYNVKNCSDCSYCSELLNCKFCLLCTNLENKEYCIRNVQYAKEDYLAEVEKIYATMTSTMLYDEYQQRKGARYVVGKTNFQKYKEGDDEENQIVKYIGSSGGNITNSYDADSIGKNGERCYEIIGGGVFEVMFSVASNRTKIFYCDACSSCQNCFGCVGLSGKEYCILNQQYTKEDYEQKVLEIIEHMQQTGGRGEFFHPRISPFGYNETIAMESFPLSRDEATERGYNWQDNTYDPSIDQGVKIVMRKDYSDQEWQKLKEDDSILQAIFICSVSGRPYRLTQQELLFYRMWGISIPDAHPSSRYNMRSSQLSRYAKLLTRSSISGEPLISFYGADFVGKIVTKKEYEDIVIG